MGSELYKITRTRTQEKSQQDVQHETRKKSVLILGGTSGLGKELAALHEEAGWYTIKTGRIEKSYSYDKKGATIHYDLSREGYKDLLGDPTVRNTNFDRFIWVAGMWLQGPFASYSSTEVQKVVEVNFTAPLGIALKLWEVMADNADPENQKSFSVISSSSGITPRAEESVYAATKHAQVGFTRSLGLENQNDNLKVSLFLPGGMKTRLYRNHPEVDTSQFNDPAKVAAKMFELLNNQEERYLEKAFPRDPSLR